MEHSFRILYPWLLLGFAIIIILASLYRWFFYKNTIYYYSLVAYIKDRGYRVSSLYKIIPFVLRILLLALIAFLASRPVFVDVNSKVHVDGIDIMLVLDASASMQCFDDLNDQRSRFLVAKTEASHFVANRPNDQIGLVLFARDAVSRCPLTLDKHMLKEILQEIEIGVIDPRGTVLSVGLAMAAKRLKDSKAKSKIVILLTDGDPTPGLDIDPMQSLEIIKKLGIKIYAIGIGGEHGGLTYQEPFGIIPMRFAYNKNLLIMLAHETGGQFFEAKNPADMKRIYQTIDQLEKTEYETNVFTRYTDLVIPFIMGCLIMLGIELFVSWIWFAV